MTKLTCLFLFSLSAIAQPNLSGIWKSESGSDQIIKIDQQGSKIDLSVRSPVNTATLHVVVGKEIKTDLNGIPVTAQAQWEGSTLVIRLSATSNGNVMRVSDRYTLSSDGNKLTGDESRKVGDQPEASQKRVLVRRPAAEWLADTGLDPAETVYKNIQLTKGQTAKELMGFMQRITVALGVGCGHCHVSGKYESDELPAKQTARKMITMVRAIDTQNFPATNAVTCWTCHRGSLKPQSAQPQIAK
ncbi:MAG TPA: c-type cytochrome [Candidatus Limnocylindrales bacterium]|nr:c-type cytochrome [Candidatus Limnocylindrales bacterium]